MFKISRHTIALSFALLFMTIAIAPSIIVSFDDNADVAFFFGENEEEEKEKENLKLHFQLSDSDTESSDIVKIIKNSDRYKYKTYPKPHLNLVFPPPDFI